VAILKFEKNLHFLKKSKFEMDISSKKLSKIIITSLTRDKTVVKVYFAILGAFKISSLGYSYAAI